MGRYQKLVGMLAAILVAALAVTASAQQYQPFGPLDFDHNLQPFAPADVSMFDEGPSANTGFFFTMDRMYISVNRPTQGDAGFHGDFTWGNRYDLGFMTEEDYGWFMELIDINGPNINQNKVGLTSFELNRAWRWKRLHGGSHVEPFIGFRYIQMDTGVLEDPLFEEVENNIYGPQVGLRWYKQNERWTISAEGRYMFAHNQQFYIDHDESEWLMAGDLRLEAQYQLWKSLAARIGFEIAHFSDGIARGPSPGSSNEEFYFYGATFGVVVNR